MSVELATLDGGEDWFHVEVMAPDYDAEYVWLWYDDVDLNDRINLNRKQLVQLSAAIDRILS